MSKANNLLTKEIKEMAEKQYAKGSSLEDQKIVAKFFNPTGRGTWYLMNIDPEDNDYAWGIVDLLEVEMGSFSISELQEYRGKMGLGIEREYHFTPRPAIDVWRELQAGRHV